LDQLELISLQESIVHKALARLEEGNRLAHRQQEIGEAAMRMQTTGEQPILMLKLSEDESEWYKTGGDDMGWPDDFEREWMEGGAFGSDA